MTDVAFVATCDLVALVRGRALPRTPLVQGGTGVGWVPANIALTAFGGIADDNPFGSRGDLRLVPDLSTEVVLPAAAPDAAPLHLFLANQTTLDGKPWDCDPRNALQIANSQLLTKHGIRVMAAFEHEFTLERADGSSLPGNPFGLDALRSAEPFGTQLLAALEAVGLPVENWLPEYGAGQFEITLKPAPALVAADRAVILREIVRDVARQNSLRASFTPLKSPNSVSNGVHAHLSLWRDDHPVTYQADGPANLSPLAVNAFAGILDHAEALLAWTAPSQISFLRLKPHRWSAGRICIAQQNREALLRICPILGFGDADPSRAFNVEYRAADATANPWLVLAALIHAMVDGLDNKSQIPEIVLGEVENSSRLLPVTLDDALAALKADQIATSWFAPDLVATHISIRLEEALALAGLNDEEKCARYFSVY